MRRPRIAVLLVLASTAAVAPVAAPRAEAAPGAFIPEAAPPLSVTTVMSGLSNAWDVAFAPDGAMFVTERAGQIRVRRPNGVSAVLAANLSDLWANGETGLMGIEVDPGFATNRRLYTCQGSTDVSGGAADGTSVQVIAWTVDAGYTTLTRVADPLVGGIDGNLGRHGGCQLRVDPQGFLRIGTGDAAVGTNPQNVNSLAGKTLRVDRFTGNGVAGNPFSGGGGNARVFTYGHRNVQGLAVHPFSGEVWSVEHGPGVDDEVNRLVAGGNYGWNPVPGYNESVPMTAPGARPAQWSSGGSTIATSGATFLRGAHWGPWQDALAVSTLAGQSLRIMRFDAGGTFVDMAIPAELHGTFGRLRAAEMGPCGVLYLTTDAGGGGSRVLAVQPRVNEGPAAQWSAANRLDVVRCGPSGGLELRTFNGSSWSGWSSLGGIATSDADLSSWGGGRLDVFAVGLDGALWHRGGQNGTFFPWENLGGVLTSAPTAVSWGPDRADVFARGADARLWTIRWTGTAWSGWQPISGVLSSAPEATSRRPGVIDVFARGTDNATYHLTWTGSGVLYPWESLGGIATSAPSAAYLGNDRTDVFARGLDGSLWSRWWNGHMWSGWYWLGGALQTAPDATSRGANLWDVFADGTDGRTYLRSLAPSGALTPWVPLPP